MGRGVIHSKRFECGFVEHWSLKRLAWCSVLWLRSWPGCNCYRCWTIHLWPCVGGKWMREWERENRFGPASCGFRRKKGPRTFCPTYALGWFFARYEALNFFKCRLTEFRTSRQRTPYHDKLSEYNGRGRGKGTTKFSLSCQLHHLLWCCSGFVSLYHSINDICLYKPKVIITWWGGIKLEMWLYTTVKQLPPV